MAIVSTTQTRQLGVTIVTVLTDLTGVVYYHWYIDGAYLGQTLAGQRSFQLQEDEQVRIEVQDTTDADFDAIANAPKGYPARRTIHWIRSWDEQFASYRISQIGGTTFDIGTKKQDVWEHEILTPRLTDLTVHGWNIYAVDRAGNEDVPAGTDALTVVRTPDAPNWNFTFDAGTDRVTFAAVAA